MGTDRTVDQQLEQVRSKHVPVVVVVLLAIFAAHDETANTAVAEQCFVDGQISQILLDGKPLLRIQRLSRLDSVEGGRWVGGVTGERIRR